MSSANSPFIMSEVDMFQNEEFSPAPENSSVSKGDVLLSSKPYAFVLKSQLRGQHCENCLQKRQVLQRCSGCALTYYCNRDCQKTSWSIHKKECPCLKRLRPRFPTDTARLLAQIIFRQENEESDVEEVIYDGKIRKFSDLMSHSTDIKEDPNKQEHFAILLALLQSYIGKENLPNSKELLEMYGRVCVNSFTITDKDLNPVGIGLYLGGSIVDHACIPNAYASFIKTQLVICSLIPWKQLNWDKVRISYIDTLNSTQTRKAELSAEYFFSCQCDLCQNEKKDMNLSSISCGNSSCGSPIFVESFLSDNEIVGPCPKCGFDSFQKDIRSKYQEIISFSQEKLSEKKNENYFSICQSVLEKQGQLLHSFNLWRIKALDAAFEYAITERNWNLAVQYGCNNLQGLKFWYGENHPSYGMALLKLAKIELFLFNLPDALQHLRIAEPILKVSHGKFSPLYKDEAKPLLKQAEEEIVMVQNSGFDVYKKKSCAENKEAA